MLAFALALACSQSTGDPLQETPPSTWSDVDRAVAELAAREDFSDSGVRAGAILSFAGVYSKTVDIQNPDELTGFSLNAARLWVEGDIADWTVHIAMRGERYTEPVAETLPGQRLFGVTGVVDPLTTDEVYVEHELVDETLSLRVGRMRTPIVSSGLYAEDRLLFDHRTFNGEVIAFPSAYTLGAELRGYVGPLRGWLALQDGHDGAGSDTALTVHGLWDVLGEPACAENEGAYGASDELALTVGGSLYWDQLDNDFSTQSVEAILTAERLALQYELVDTGAGFAGVIDEGSAGDEHYSYAATASFLILDDLEIAARYESVERDDSPFDSKRHVYIRRLSINKYFEGHDLKLQAVYTTADGNQQLANVDLFSLGMVVSL